MMAGPASAHTWPSVPLVGRYVLPQAIGEGLQEGVHVGGQAAHQVAGGRDNGFGNRVTAPASSFGFTWREIRHGGAD